MTRTDDFRIEMEGTVETDGVVFIQSIRPGDMQTSRLVEESVGLELQAKNKRSELRVVASASQLYACLRKLTTEHWNGRRPVVHLDMHGDPEGVWLTDGSSVRWDDLHSRLRVMNQASKNNLVVVLATCFGYGAIRDVDPTQLSPFCFAFGWDREVSQGTLVDELPAFYRRLLLGEDINAALFPGLRTYCAEDVIFRALVPCAAFFLMGRGRRTMGEFHTSLAMDLGLPLGLARRLSRELSDPVGERVFRKYWVDFLMADHPANTGRFAFKFDELVEFARRLKVKDSDIVGGVDVVASRELDRTLRRLRGAVGREHEE